VAVRGDDKMTLWDLRKAAAPLLTYLGLDSLHETSGMAWSPDGKVLAAGTSVRKGQGTGMLKFFTADSAEPVVQVGAAPGASVVQVVWHAKLQQIVCGTSAGPLRLFYDPLLSKHGALLTAGRVPRRSDPSDVISADPFAAVGVIINPHALPMFQDEKYKKRRRGEEEVRPGDLRRPDRPLNGPAAQSVSQPIASKIFEEAVLEGRIKRHNLKDQDSREELLKYAASAPKRLDHAAPLADKTLEEENEEAKREERRIAGLAMR
jgi:hypothetical protein